MPNKPQSDEIVATCHGVNVPANAGLFHEKRLERIRAERYEWQEVQGAMQVVRKGDNVLELGAGVGLVGAIIAKNCNPAKVVSFEANPNLLGYINHLYKTNRLDKTIEVRNRIVIASPEPVDSIEFFVRRSYLGSTMIKPQGYKQDSIHVPVTTFEAVRKELSPDVIISDIEGGELDLLRHADISGVRAVVMELHPKVYGVEGLRECRQILESSGFIRDTEVSSRTVVIYRRDL